MDEGGEWLRLLLGEGTNKDIQVWISLESHKVYQNMVSGTRPMSNYRNVSRVQISKQEINAGTG